MATETNRARDERYLNYLLEAVRAAARKPPQFGTGKGVSIKEFKRLYGDDPFYAWIGLDSDLLYAAHKASATMTSLYRKLGDGCQDLWRAIIRDQFGVTDEGATWEYTVPTDKGLRKRTLDGRIDVLDFPKSAALTRFQKQWLPKAKKKLGAKINPRGAVFEVRQGYKSQDAKRSGRGRRQRGTDRSREQSSVTCRFFESDPRADRPPLCRRRLAHPPRHRCRRSAHEHVRLRPPGHGLRSR